MLKSINKFLGWLFVLAGSLTGVILSIIVFVYLVLLTILFLVSILPVLILLIPFLLTMIGIWFIEK